MDDELKAKLQGLFDADKQRKETVVKQINERQERQNQFVADFSRIHMADERQ